MPASALLASATLAVTPLGDHVLDPAARAAVSFGITVNAASYQQDGLLTHRGRQYTTWYSGDGRAWVARRRLPDGGWRKVRLAYRLPADDSHDAISLGVTPVDDRLHVAFPTHGDEIRYLRSARGISTRRWGRRVFGPVLDALPGAPDAPRTWTYPQFEQAGRDTLLTYRDGRHDDGRQLLLRYERGRWRLLGRFTDSRGTWGPSASRYAYLHGFTWNAVRRRLEVAFTWRERAAAGCGEVDNHDVGYASSADGGLTWRNSAGSLIARTGTDDLIAVSDPHVVLPVAVDRGLMNQEAQATDSRGRFHVMTSLVPGTHCVADFYGERARGARPQHSWRDRDGTWHTTRLPFLSGGAGRTKLVFGPRDDAYVVLPDGRIAAARAKKRWTEWRMLGERVHAVGEVVVDRRRRGTLSVAYQDAQGRYRVADFRLGR